MTCAPPGRARWGAWSTPRCRERQRKRDLEVGDGFALSGEFSVFLRRRPPPLRHARVHRPHQLLRLRVLHSARYLEGEVKVQGKAANQRGTPSTFPSPRPSKGALRVRAIGKEQQAVNLLLGESDHLRDLLPQRPILVPCLSGGGGVVLPLAPTQCHQQPRMCHLLKRGGAFVAARGKRQRPQEGAVHPILRIPCGREARMKERSQICNPSRSKNTTSV